MSAGGEKTDRGGIQVIARAAAILRSLRDDPSGLSLGQIAQRTGLPRSTVQRIVAALQAEEMISLSGDRGAFRLGPELTRMSSVARNQLIERCRPHLEHLSRKLGETSDLSVLRDGRMTFIDQVAGTHRLRTVSAIGEAFPLTNTANGRAVLAAMPAARAKALSMPELRGDESAWQALRLELAAVRRAGLSHDRDEHSAGISATGGAFQDEAGDWYAISIPVPSSRYEGIRRDVEKALIATLAELQDMTAAPYRAGTVPLD